jgi:NADH:ubiquinone oxidoreductase subunit E
MAWITKNSATMQIARREEPYLTAGMKQDLMQRIMPRYETNLACTLPALHLIQHEYGWIPFQAMEEIAEFLDLNAADVLDTASFYEEYWLKPKGRHLIGVCRSIACEFCGQPGITDAIKARLNIDVGETTDDGRFTLIELECIGACGGAPAALIDETLHENLTPQRIVELIDAVKDDHGGH